MSTFIGRLSNAFGDEVNAHRDSFITMHRECRFTDMTYKRNSHPDELISGSCLVVVAFAPAKAFMVPSFCLSFGVRVPRSFCPQNATKRHGWRKRFVDSTRHIRDKFSDFVCVCVLVETVSADEPSVQHWWWEEIFGCMTASSRSKKR
jgi:hypothetical protein